MDEVIVHLNVLGPCVGNGVLRELDPVELVVVDRSNTSSCRSLSSRFNHMASHVATTGPRYSASVLDSATVGCFLLLHAIAIKTERVSRRGSAIGCVASPISIGVAD